MRCEFDWKKLGVVLCLNLLFSTSNLCSAHVRVTTVCALTTNPLKFSGKTVSLRAYVIVDYHGMFLAVRKCKKMLPLVLPEGSQRTPQLTLSNDDSYKLFDAALHDYRPGTLQPKRSVEATFEGRFEYIFEVKDGKEVRVAKGLGPSGSAQWQFVLQRVSGVELKGPA